MIGRFVLLALLGPTRSVSKSQTHALLGNPSECPGDGLTPISWHYSRHFNYGGAIENRNNRPLLAQRTSNVIEEPAALQGLGASLECSVFERLGDRMFNHQLQPRCSAGLLSRPLGFKCNRYSAVFHDCERSRHRRESDDHPVCWFHVCSTVTGNPFHSIPKEKVGIEEAHLPRNNERSSSLIRCEVQNAGFFYDIFQDGPFSSQLLCGTWQGKYGLTSNVNIEHDSRQQMDYSSNSALTIVLSAQVLRRRLRLLRPFVSGMHVQHPQYDCTLG